MNTQNRSHAVMAQRYEDKTSLDDFPTPPWAVRALIEQHIAPVNDVGAQTCWEPACGRGHMASTLREHFKEVRASDVADYGYGRLHDFATQHESSSILGQNVDWVITNPPFRLAEDFFFNAISYARIGVALLVRTVFIESVGRYQRIFAEHPPAFVAQFCERVAMVKGRLDPKASTATGYAWIVWTTRPQNRTELRWIVPCRKSLERATDYESSFLKVNPSSTSTSNDPTRDLFEGAFRFGS